MSRVDFLSLAGLRADGRRPNETRRIRCRMGVLERADGSAYYEQGNTKVLVSVMGPQEVTRRSDAQHDAAVLKVDFTLAPYSGMDRKERSRGDRKQLEAAMALQRVFSTVVLTDLYPRSQIVISVLVTDADGGELCAACNAVSLALQDTGVAMADAVVGISAGYLEETPMLDLNSLEGTSGCPEVPLAYYPASGKIAMVQCSARLPLHVFDDLMTLAVSGARSIHDMLKAVVKEHIQGVLSGEADATASIGTAGMLVAVDLPATQGATSRVAGLKLVSGEEDVGTAAAAAAAAGSKSHAQLGAASIPEGTQGLAAGMGEK